MDTRNPSRGRQGLRHNRAYESLFTTFQVRRDLRKSINGRIYIKEGGVPSKFDWSGPSPKKRKAPTERQPLPAKKQLLAEDNSHRSDQSASVNSEAQETVEMSACEPSTSFEDDTCKTPDLERQIAEQST